LGRRRRTSRGLRGFEILLALPLVLSGLGLAYLTHSYGSARIGGYIKQRLWPVLQEAYPDHGQAPTLRLSSWEEQCPRGLKQAMKPPGGLLSWLPGLIIFGAPSAAGLAINSKHMWFFTEDGPVSGLEVAWFIGTVVAALSLLLIFLVGISDPSPGSAGQQREPLAQETAVKIVAQLSEGHSMSGTAVLRLDDD
jgi:hypothetical protein